MDYQLFLKCIQFSEAIKSSKPNIYFFLKDCAIQRIYKENGNRFPTPDSQNICNQFQMEMQQAQWQRNKISKQEYQEFLEGLFKKVDFSKIDLESYKILKALTENTGIFGNFDKLTGQRIDYINQKIQKLASNPPKNGMSIFSILPTPTTVVQNLPSGGGIDLPDAGKGDNKVKKINDAEMARLNEIMKQMKLNSPIYITNVQPGQFYNPYSNPNYIPNGVNRNVPLPMRKTDPNYHHLKAMIEKELILANQELDYHKIDMARNHLEIAAYYLKNVID